MITVGIPVYNEEEFIRETLNSVVENLEWIDKVIITDNNSTDSTGIICREFEEKYDKIFYIKHKKNIGSIKNFEYSLLRADSKYFMWLGGHDCISKNYIKGAVSELEKNSEVSLVYGQFDKIDKYGNTLEIIDDINWSELYSDNPFERVFSHIRNIRFNYFFYGVYRTELIKQAYINKKIIGVDVIITLKVCSQGKFIQSRNIKYLIRDIRKESEDEAVNRYKKMLWKSSIFTINPYRKLIKGYIDVISKTAKISNTSIKKSDWLPEVKESLRKSYGETNNFKMILNLLCYEILKLTLNDNQLLLLKKIIRK